MSHFTKIKSQFKDQEALIAALTEVPSQNGKPWTLDQIEVHETPQRLVNAYDRAVHEAEIVIRKQHTKSYSDFGFARQTDGTFSTIIDSDARFYGKSWQANLRKRYGVNVAKQKAEAQGWQMEEAEVEGKVQVTLSRWA